MTNDRGDEIQSGVVKGVPVSRRARWLMLWAQWLPYTVFFVGILAIAAVGNLEIARISDDRHVGIFAYMCSTFLAMAAVFSLILGAFLFVNMLSSLRQKTRD